MGHSSAEDVLSAFKDGILELPLHSIMQVSMDGPNVNWSFLKMFNAYLQTSRGEYFLKKIGNPDLRKSEYYDMHFIVVIWKYFTPACFSVSEDVHHKVIPHRRSNLTVALVKHKLA